MNNPKILEIKSLKDSKSSEYSTYNHPTAEYIAKLLHKTESNYNESKGVMNNHANNINRYLGDAIDNSGRLPISIIEKLFISLISIFESVSNNLRSDFETWNLFKKVFEDINSISDMDLLSIAHRESDEFKRFDGKLMVNIPCTTNIAFVFNGYPYGFSEDPVEMSMIKIKEA